ncbi:hypothetical protein BC937DRAFT_86759 [Endogone sp. FLAS-F59071]|nr:hypothetical protein BC937DRAFT_86759 [Endogone sp. FLAS-F59071]|eukprot:RUS22802.1 hypothetical protein BC937DRAFT_86759 [Endogone sp. FLAS-F59071]
MLSVFIVSIFRLCLISRGHSIQTLSTSRSGVRTPETRSISVLLTAFVSSLQAGVIDGVIWATVHTPPDEFPATILVPDGGCQPHRQHT